MFKRFFNSLFSVLTLALATPKPAYAHNVPDHSLQSAMVHPFVSPDHLFSIIAVGIIAAGIAYLLKKRTSR